MAFGVRSLEANMEGTPCKWVSLLQPVPTGVYRRLLWRKKRLSISSIPAWSPNWIAPDLRLDSLGVAIPEEVRHWSGRFGGYEGLLEE